MKFREDGTIAGYRKDENTQDRAEECRMGLILHRHVQATEAQRGLEQVMLSEVRTFQGSPCIRCGGTERYVKRRDCAHCTRVRNSQRSRVYLRDDNNRDRDRARQWKCRGLPVPARPRPEVCECCGQHQTGSGVLHLDHDHCTGKFRGWLCQRCNHGFGMFGDSRDGVMRAVLYMDRAV